MDLWRDTTGDEFCGLRGGLGLLLCIEWDKSTPLIFFAYALAAASPLSFKFPLLAPLMIRYGGITWRCSLLGSRLTDEGGLALLGRESLANDSVIFSTFTFAGLSTEADDSDIVFCNEISEEASDFDLLTWFLDDHDFDIPPVRLIFTLESSEIDLLAATVVGWVNHLQPIGITMQHALPCTAETLPVAHSVSCWHAVLVLHFACSSR